MGVFLGQWHTTGEAVATHSEPAVAVDRLILMNDIPANSSSFTTPMVELAAARQEH
jgi:hypothetical protein